jgi:signal transduction histidine kinase
MSTLPTGVWWAFLTAGLALAVILLALGAALVIYQRRFVALHRRHAAGLLRAQEEERAWVARELHDDVLQRIAVVLHEVDGVRPGAAGARAASLRAELEDLAHVVRRVANHLHPAFLEREGLVPALRSLAAEMTERSGVALQVVEEPGTVPLSATPDQALVAFRVAQEAVANLVRHSGASAGEVHVRAGPDSFELEITDRGHGFAPEQRWKTGHLGLISMAERAEAAGGRLTVTSLPGDGTVVRLRLPCQGPGPA